MKHKLNKYVHLIAEGTYSVLFNVETETFFVLNQSLADHVEACRADIDRLEELHPDLYQQMLAGRMILPADEDEVESLVERWKKNDNNPASFSMIINPTLNCNLRCWYCYEEHDRKPMMTHEVLESVKKLISKKAEEAELKRLNVSFFGGEPLLGFREVVKPLLQHASDVCSKKGIPLSSNFTTNGVLLTGEVLDFLGSLTLSRPATFQISLDGNRELHDNTRVGVNRKPTYDIIVAHMKRAAERGHSISARLNYTSENILAFADVLDDFADLTEEGKKNIRFNFQQIWQDQAKGDIQHRVEERKSIFKGEGFEVDSDHINHRHLCYADMENHIVVNSDGNVFKCTARDFLPKNSEGVLTPEGEILWNEKFHSRMAVKYSNKECLACGILPICNGGCTQNKMESGNKDQCYRHMGENDKKNYLMKRLKQLIEKQAERKRNHSVAIN